MTLKSKQVAKLKSLAHHLNPVFQIGKDGLSDNLFKGLNDALEAHELIKISVLKNCSTPINEAAFDIASNTNSEIVQIIGRNIVLYRKSKKQLIEL